MLLAAPPAPQERLPRPSCAGASASKENEWTSPVRGGGYGSPGSLSPWIGGTEKIADKAWMNISPSAASTTVPWEVTMSDAWPRAESAESENGSRPWPSGFAAAAGAPAKLRLAEFLP